MFIAKKKLFEFPHRMKGEYAYILDPLPLNNIWFVTGLIAGFLITLSTMWLK